MQTKALLASLILVSGTAHGFSPDVHIAITGDALAFVSTTDPASGTPLGFGAGKVGEITIDNIKQDADQVDGTIHADGGAIAAASERVGSKRRAILSRLAAGNGEGARELLGEALHTIQDFYSHSTWLDAGFSGIAPLGAGLIGQANACVDGVPRRGMLTSGYFSIGAYLDENDALELLLNTAAGNCLHGQSVFFGLSVDGIHKDEPGRPFHPGARSLATVASRDFAQGIVNELASQGRYEAIYAFLGQPFAPSIFPGTYRTEVFEVFGSRYTLFGCDFEQKRRGTLTLFIGAPSQAPYEQNQNYAVWDYVTLQKPVASRPDIYGCAPTDWGSYGNSSKSYALTHQSGQVDGVGMNGPGRPTQCPIPGCFDSLTIHALTPTSIHIELESFYPGGTVGGATWFENHHEFDVEAVR